MSPKNCKGLQRHLANRYFFCLRSQIYICASHKELNIHTQNTCAIYKNNSGCPPFAMCNDLNDLFFTALIFAHRQKMVHPPKISVKWFLVKEFVPRHINSYSNKERVNARLSVTKVMIQAKKKTWSSWTFWKRAWLWIINIIGL